MTAGTPSTPCYFASGAEFDDERDRLRLLEQGHDPVTIRHLIELGVGTGWRCLELGAGGGSIARWMAQRVGCGGRVVATDIDTRFLGHLDAPNIEVRRLDVVSSDLGDRLYDLVHCRGLLFHLRSPEDVLAKMVGATRPGGWVLVEEADLATFAPLDDSHPFAASGALGRMVAFACDRGLWNASLGRRLPQMLMSLGLIELGNEISCRVVRGGEAMAAFVERSYSRLDEALRSNGVVTEAEIAMRSSAFSDPDFWFLNHLLVSVWGRRSADLLQLRNSPKERDGPVR